MTSYSDFDHGLCLGKKTGRIPKRSTQGAETSTNECNMTTLTQSVILFHRRHGIVLLRKRTSYNFGAQKDRFQSQGIPPFAADMPPLNECCMNKRESTSFFFFRHHEMCI